MDKFKKVAEKNPVLNEIEACLGDFEQGDVIPMDLQTTMMTESVMDQEFNNFENPASDDDEADTTPVEKP